MQWVVVLVIIVVAVVSAIAQTVKNQQEKEPPRRRTARPRADAESRADGEPRAGSSDMDRFLQEIEKLRKRGGDEPRKPQRPNKPAKTVPTVAPVKRSRRVDPVPTVAPPSRFDRLPTATVLTQPELPSPITQSAPQPGDAPAVSRAPRPVGTTPFSKNLLAMLGDTNSLPLAIVLQEILGPPRSQKPHDPTRGGGPLPS